MGNEAMVGGVIELAKLALTIYFQAAAMSGMSEIERDKLFIQVKEQFLKRDPANAPDV